MIPVPFEGFAVPGPAYLAALLVGTTVVAGLLYTARPPVTGPVVLAFAPWMVAGAALYVRYRLGGYPAVVAPLFSAPSVYLTTFVGMAAVWVVALRRANGDTTAGTAGAAVTRPLAAAGAAVATVGVALALLTATGPERSLSPALPLAGVAVAAVLTVAVDWLLRNWRPATAAVGRVGTLVIFAHALDGVTTAVGVDLLGAGEQSVLPARIMEFAAGLPTAAYFGRGWLFVLVKLVVAAAVVVAFSGYAHDEPTEGYLLFALVTAVGLGPGAHNALLFALSG